MRDELLQELQLCCNLLAPLLLEDPARSALVPLLQQLAAADAAQLAGEWPLRRPGTEEALEAACSQLVEGARLAVDHPQRASRSFHHLFVGPAHLDAPPWGSVYTDHEKVCFGESCLELGLWMRRQGIECLTDATEPPDHIGRMMSLLGWLAAQRPELVEEYLREHLLTWSHHYFERLSPVAQAEGHPLYCAVGALADELLLAAQAQLGLEIRYPRYFM
ncbi:MAG: molecular chaperone TorD family protein [Coriobacteriales bacterium]